MSKIKNNKPHDLNPNEARAHFIAKGTTFNAWVRSKGYNPSTAKMALRGKRNGELSRKIIKALRRELKK